MNAANLATIARVLMVPVIVMVYYSGQPWSQLAAAVIFTIASITDGLL